MRTGDPSIMTTSGTAGSEGRCPVCGEDTLADIDSGGDDLFQDAESRQVDSYTCGHEVPRAPLEVADADRLDVLYRDLDAIVTEWMPDRAEFDPLTA